jgi:nitrogen fixation NifU-like protein
MNELDELYQQVILDHNKNPRNFGKLENPSHSAEGHNPLCGDQIELSLNIEDGKILEVKFEGSGCAISKASASIMTTLLKGKTINEAEELFNRFHAAVTSDPNSEDNRSDLGKLAVFSGVREFPARIKCASLAWHTFMDAISDKKSIASTELEL